MNRLAVEVRPLREDEVGILEAELRRYTTETHQDRFQEQQRGETTYLVAWLGEQPAGYARIKWKPTFMMGLALRDTPTIGDVTVRPDLRSRGIGDQIMQRAEDLVRARGFSRLALGVEIDNARATDFYHRRGYLDAGIPPDRTNRYLLGEGELWHEGDKCICLVKDLNPVGALIALARAKVNLMHIVGARRRDGFHSVQSVMQSLTLADEITFRRAKGVSISWAAGLGGEVPSSPDLVERTLRFGSRKSAKIKGLGAQVTKRIPLGSGLAGGSADAAATLKALEALDPTSFTPDLLIKQARRLGADVPFCLTGGIALATGKGERLTPLENRRNHWWVVGIPDFSLSTEEVYRRFDLLSGASDETGLRTPAQLKKALRAGDLNAIGASMSNDLERPAFELKPELESLKRVILAAGAYGAVMTGSGSAIIGLCGTEGEAGVVAQKVRGAFPRVEVAATTTVGAEVLGRPHSKDPAGIV